MSDLPDPDPACSDCSPVPYTLSRFQRFAISYLLSSFLLVALLVTALRIWVGLAPVAVGISGALGILLFVKLKSVGLDALPRPPTSWTSSSRIPEVTGKYLESYDRALFGWFALLGAAHSIAVAIGLQLIKTEDSHDIGIGAVIGIFLALLTAAGQVAIRASASRMRRFVHVAKHHPESLEVMRYVHRASDGHVAAEIVVVVLAGVAVVWAIVGTLLLLASLLSALA